MKARIIRDSTGYYIGEVYGTWTNVWTKVKWTGWKSVTDSCITKFGAKLELKRWKQENDPDEFEI